MKVRTNHNLAISICVSKPRVSVAATAAAVTVERFFYLSRELATELKAHL